jgi:thiamine transport system ATP-binding protein
LVVSAPRLAVRGARVAFGPRPALVDVDLEVGPAEVVAVLGPSGSGKSTLLRAVAGLQPLDAGSVEIDGRALDGVPVHRRGVGLMFQDHALFPHRDVAGNVGFGLRMQGWTRTAIARRVAELLAVVDLPGSGSRPVDELSGGEQQRVALARALAPSPAVLLLDEPLGALDRALRERLLDELRAIFTAQALTVVAVTHDQAEAVALADRIVLLDQGRVVQAGPPGEVWAAPASRRAAELLGFTNLVAGTASRGRVSTPWGDVPAPLAASGTVTVVVRPDAIVIGRRGGVRAVVRERTFHGARTTLDLDIEGAPPLRADVPSAVAPSRGERVVVRIDPDGVVVLAG